MKTDWAMNQTKVIIYGGNGFVGSHIAKSLVERNASPVCISRTGTRPRHLQEQSWSENVKWCQGDASVPKAKSLASADTIICAVGSPPFPAFKQSSWDKQFFSNGTANIRALDAAAEAGVKRAIVIGAQIITPLKTDSFAYYKGKRLTYEAAKRFAEYSEQQTAAVFQPSIVIGTRYTQNGKAVPLNLLSPLSTLSKSIMVDVERLANRAADAALDFSPPENFEVFTNKEI